MNEISRKPAQTVAPWPNLQAPVSNKKLADHHGARGGGCGFRYTSQSGGLGLARREAGECGHQNSERNASPAPRRSIAEEQHNNST